MRRSLLFIVLCWPLLMSGAPVPVGTAPDVVYLPALTTAVATRQAPTPMPVVVWHGTPLVQASCTPASAVAVLREDVIPFGKAEAWSCTSVDQAKRWLAYHVALVRAPRSCYEANPSGQCPVPPSE